MSLHYMNADKSPALPQTPAELTAFKAKSEKIKLEKEVQKKQSLVKSDEKDAGERQPVLFRGKQLPDKLSPVFGVITCFDGEPEKKKGLRVQWPTLAELKEDGDRRSHDFDRCLPIPHLDLLSIRLPPGLPTPHDSLKDKKISVIPRSIPPLSTPDLDDSDASYSSSDSEVDESDLAPSLKQILNMIEDIEGNDEDLVKEEAEEEIKEVKEDTEKAKEETKEAKGETKEEVKAGDKANDGT